MRYTCTEHTSSPSIRSNLRNVGAHFEAATGPPLYKTLKHAEKSYTIPCVFMTSYNLTLKRCKDGERPKEWDGGTRENTYSHLMPEQTWDSSRAVSTPRGRTWELLLMVGQWLQFTQDTNTKGFWAYWLKHKSRLSWHASSSKPCNK